MQTLAFIEQELKKTYPTRIVSDLKRTNEDLYIKLREYSKEHNTSIKNLLEDRDYIYLRKSIIRLYVDDFIELEKAFPDYKISGFYESNNKLYYRVLAHAKSLKVSLKKYLNSLGFDYEAREELNNDTTKEELTKLYPNKVVKGLSAKDNKLYYRVYQQAKKENLSLNDYLAKIGFTVDSSRNTEKATETKTKTTKSSTKKTKTEKEPVKVKSENKKTTPKTKSTRSKKVDTKLEKIEPKKRGRKPKTENASKNINNKKTQTVKTAKKNTTRKATSKKVNTKVAEEKTENQ